MPLADAGAVRAGHRAGARLASDRRVPGIDYMSFAAVGTAGAARAAQLHVRRHRRDRRPRVAAPGATCSPRRSPGPSIVVANLAVAAGDHRAAGGGAARRRTRYGAPSFTPRPAAPPGSWGQRRSSPSACTAWPRPWPTASRRSRSTPAPYRRVAIVPFFFAGSLFPITALPGFLTAFARVLPLTHALALMRYGAPRSQRDRPPRHLGHVERQRGSRPQPPGGRHLRRRPDRGRHPHLHPRRRALTGDNHLVLDAIAVLPGGPLRRVRGLNSSDLRRRTASGRSRPWQRPAPWSERSGTRVPRRRRRDGRRRWPRRSASRRCTSTPKRRPGAGDGSRR